PPAPALATGRTGQRSFAEEPCARILIAHEFGAHARTDGEERRLAAIRARRTQKPVAGEDRIEGADAHRLDMHAGKIEVPRVGFRFVAGNLAEAGQPQQTGLPGDVRNADSPAQDGGLPLVGADLHARLDAVQRVDDREAIEARLFDPIVAGAPRRLEADRPRLRALLAEVEEMAARLQRVERATEEVDR